MKNNKDFLAVTNTRTSPNDFYFRCIDCLFFTENNKKIVSHINKFHPPQAPKEWICKCRRLKTECKKHFKGLKDESSL